jgi:hypothetical protein
VERVSREDTADRAKVGRSAIYRYRCRCATKSYRAEDLMVLLSEYARISEKAILKETFRALKTVALNNRRDRKKGQ